MQQPLFHSCCNFFSVSNVSKLKWRIIFLFTHTCHFQTGETKLEEEIKDADIVITGEGCLDAQTAMGKAPIGVAKLAKKYGKLVLGFSGAVTKGATACNEAGIDAYFPIVRSAVSLEDAMKKKNAQENLIDTVEQVFRLIKVLK